MTDEHSENKESFNDAEVVESKVTLTQKMRENPWILSTAVLGIITLVLVFAVFGNGGSITGNVVSANQASDDLISFLGQNAPSEISLVDVTERSGLYEVAVEYEGEEFPLYVTKDGKFFVQSIVPLSAPQTTTNTNTQTQQASSYSEEDLEEIAVFMQCLAEKNVKIYGANWCGYTKQLVDNLGGFEVIAPIYIECTEESDVCSQEGVTGYPTIKIDGESANVARTLQGFADATGCTVPVVGAVLDTSATASC